MLIADFVGVMREFRALTQGGPLECLGVFHGCDSRACMGLQAESRDEICTVHTEMITI